MPRHAHWVIIVGATPTAFRAKDREILVPTLKQLSRTQPDAALQWFERGKLWASPAEANAARRAVATRPRRPATWRPGGEHTDPRARYEMTRDEKRARFKRRQRLDATSPKPETRSTSSKSRKAPR